jgi:hypothetical protein
MSDVVVQVLDKDKTVLYTYNSVCYAGMRKWGNTIEYPTALQGYVGISTLDERDG